MKKLLYNIADDDEFDNHTCLVLDDPITGLKGSMGATEVLWVDLG